MYVYKVTIRILECFLFLDARLISEVTFETGQVRLRRYGLPPGSRCFDEINQ